MNLLKVLLLSSVLGYGGSVTLMRTHDTMPVPESKKLQIDLPSLLQPTVHYKLSATPPQAKITLDPFRRPTPATRTSFVPRKMVVNRPRTITVSRPRFSPVAQRPSAVRAVLRRPLMKPARKMVGFHINHGIIVNKFTGKISRVIPSTKKAKITSAKHYFVRRTPVASGVARFRKAPFVVKPHPFTVQRAPINSHKLFAKKPQFVHKFRFIARRNSKISFRPIGGGMSKFLPAFMQKRPFLRKGQDTTDPSAQPTADSDPQMVGVEAYTYNSPVAEQVDLSGNANQVEVNTDTNTMTVGQRGGDAMFKILGYKEDGTPVLDRSQTINPLTPITIAGYDEDGNPIEVIEYFDEDLPQGGPNDIVAYDDAGAPLYARPLPSQAGNNSEDDFEPNSGEGAAPAEDPSIVGYDEAGNPIYSAPPAEPDVTYDENGNPSSSADYTGVVGYDESGNPIYATDPTGESSTVLYDENGNPISSDSGTALYDENGNPISTDSGTVLYDENGNPISGDSGTVLYDENGNPISNDSGTTLYDENGNPIPAESEQPIYDADGNLIGYADQSGSIDYDQNGEPIPNNESEQQQIGYDADGNPVYSDGSALEVVGYDENGNPVYSSPPADEDATSTVEEYQVDSTSVNADLSIATPGSADNLGTLIIAVEGVQSIFNDIYTKIPQDPIQLPDASDEQAVTDWYDNAAAFVRNTMAQQDKINRDLDFVKNDLEAVTLTTSGIVEYFGLTDKYNTAQASASAGSAEFEQLNESLVNLLNSSSDLIRGAIDDIEQITPKMVVIMNDCQVIRDNLDTSADLTIQNKSEAISQVLPAIIQSKFEIDQILADLIGKLSDLQSRQGRAASSIDVMIGLSSGAEGELSAEDGGYAVKAKRKGLI